MTKTSKITKVGTLVTASATALRLYTDYKVKWDNKRQHSLALEEGSYTFVPMMNWLHENAPNTRHAKMISTFNDQRLIHNQQKSLKFVLDGYKIHLEASEDKPRLDTDEYGDVSLAKKSVMFTCSQAEGIQALQRLLDELREEKRKKGTGSLTGYINASYGWSGRTLPMRYLDMIFLPRGVKEDLVFDIDYFMENEEEYAKIGAPWHRGYLLYGPPGNGKTSLAQALAHYYQRDLYSLSLATIKSDSELSERMTSMTSKSFLLLEDLDVFRHSVQRDKADKTSASLAGLLNAFDGINTPHGMVTFMNTNVKDTLDPALIRPGRMDRHIELKAPDDYQITEMFKAVYGQELSASPKQFDSMASYAEVLKNNIGDPEGARMEIKR